MTQFSSAVWHKDLKNVLRGHAMSNLGINVNGSGQLVMSAGVMMVDGVISATPALTASGTTALNTTNFSAGLHANNPYLEEMDDSSSTVRVVRQNALTASWLDGQQSYVIITISGSAWADASALKGALRFYSGEIVTSGAKRPSLDLSAEVVIGEFLVNNDSGSTDNLVESATAGDVTGIKNLAFINSY